MAADAGTATGNGLPACVEEGLNPFVAEINVIRVHSKWDDWEALGVRVAEAACGSGVAAMRAAGRDAVYCAVRGAIHARTIAALRGLDLQCTMGYQKVRGRQGDLISSVVLYCWARREDRPQWEEFSDETDEAS